jgi:hypothetical protein
MKTVLIALERETFNYLYKFDNCDISLNRIINEDFGSLQRPLQKLSLRALAKQFEKSLPYFESEDEVILIEYLKESIQFEEGIRIKFDGIIGIIPLSASAKNSLESRLNKDFRIYEPIPEELLKDILRVREDKKRTNAVYCLLGYYKLDVSNEFLDHLRGAIIKRVLNDPIDKKLNKSLANLIDFDLTPSFIPSGNVESFLKLGCIFLIFNGQSDLVLLKNGPFFRVITENMDSLNSKSLLKAYSNLQQLFAKANKDDHERLYKAEKTFNGEFEGFNVFLAYFIYLSLNRRLKDEDYNLIILKAELEELKNEYPKELAHALAIFGYVHSFDRLYESIHRLSNSPLFKTSISSPIELNSIQKDQNTLTKEQVEAKRNDIPDSSEKSEKPETSSKEIAIDIVTTPDKEKADSKLTDSIKDSLSGSPTLPNEIDKSKSSETGIQDVKPKSFKSTPNISNLGKSLEIFVENAKESNSNLEPENKHIDTYNRIDSIEDSKVGEDEISPNITSRSYKELNHQSIDSLISNIRFRSKKDNQQKDRLLDDLNIVFKKEVISGDDSFSFPTIKAFLLSIGTKNASLNEIIGKMIVRVEKEFKS